VLVSRDHHASVINVSGNHRQENLPGLEKGPHHSCRCVFRPLLDGNHSLPRIASLNCTRMSTFPLGPESPAGAVRSDSLKSQFDATRDDQGSLGLLETPVFFSGILIADEVIHTSEI